MCLKISNIEIISVSYKLGSPYRWGAMEVPALGSTLVRVETDDNIVGVGEAGFSSTYEPFIKPQVEKLKSVVLLRDPFDVESIWQEMYDVTHMWGRRGFETYAISGIENALWDIIGKACGKPVYKILGGYKDSVRAYAAPSLKEPKIIRKECKEFVEQGYTAIKLRTGLGLDKDLEIVKGVREEVGNGVELFVDGNMAYDHNQAVEMAKRYSRYEVGMFEEPVKAHSVEEYVREMLRLKKKIDIPLSGGECFFTRYEYGELLSKQAVDVVQPDATAVGGILECKKVGVMASVWGIKCIPHISCSSVPAFGLAANLHVICSLSNSPLMEFPVYETPLRNELVDVQIRAEKGYVKAPNRPGLGMVLNNSAVEKYRDNK